MTLFNHDNMLFLLKYSLTYVSGMTVVYMYSRAAPTGGAEGYII